MTPSRIGSLAAAVLAALVLAAPDGRAADFYLSGNLLISGGSGEASGSTDFFPISGSDSDSSPAFGTSLGLAFALDEAFPSIGSVETPSWRLRLELEGLAGRDYELRSDGGDGFFSDVESWSLLTNVWLDLPVHRPLAWAFGRIPILEPMSLYVGGGIGMAQVDVETTDNVSRGSEDTTNFAYQAGIGLGYDFTDWATLSAGYRYHDMGDVETTLSVGPGLRIGSHELDLDAHEFVTSLRIRFHSTPLENLSPRRWSLPRWSRSDW